MKEQEFGEEYLRLFSGFGADGQLTPERMRASFERWGYLPLAVMRCAVSRALTETKLPAGDWFDRILDEEHNAHLDQERAARDQDAKRFLAGRQDFRGASREWADGHYRAIMLMLSGKPHESNAILEAIKSPARYAV